ncbi:Gfo/Idh/MocA family protein [Brachybacterium sp. AOP42-E1-35]|uniref:Gfo/Idh/MocA family protein n=1 Tax=Brachybacterium sp. AOP42-E1-35 TaxID=3457664 RepID=UPI00402AE032
MAMKPPLGIGILGAGVIAGDDDGFLPNIGQLEGTIHVPAIADVIRAKADDLAQRFSIPSSYGSLEELLEDPRVDAVANLTPISEHAETSLAILQAGKHLISEKPIATTLEDAGAIIQAAQERDLAVVCAPPDALYRQYLTARKMIDAGDIGKVAFARVRSSHAGPGGAADGWPGDPSWYYTDGSGPLYDMGVYGIHEITALLGPARRVSAFGGITEPERTVRGNGPFAGTVMPVTTPDNYLFMLDFGEATFAVVDATYNVHASMAPKVEVFGRRGAMAIYHRDENPLEVYRQDLAPGVDGWMAAEDLLEAKNVREIALHRAMLFEHLAECLSQGLHPITDAEHARHALEVMLAVRESSRTGRAVELTTTFSGSGS